MAVFANTDNEVIVNGVDLSDWVTQASVNFSVDELDASAMGTTYHARIGGLKDFSFTIEFNQDFAASAVDQTIWGIGLGGTTVVKIKPTSASTSSTNPQYVGTVLVSQYPVLNGGIGEVAKTSVTWPCAAGTLHRGTS
jgi:hypothetical protein